jgi:hypothetical protein
MRIEGDCFKMSLHINFPKCGVIPIEERRHIGFDVDLGTGYFRVPVHRWEEL